VYHLVDRPETLVIGPGGGRDVLAALASGAPHVTAVEVNPAVVEAVRGPFADFAGHLYDRPDVTVVVEDARGYIARSPHRYDVIQAALIDTWAAGASGAFALSENSLYTVEAFRTYYEHLTDRGILTVSRWYMPGRPAETLRLVSTGMAGWARAGVADPRQHVAVIAHFVTSNPQEGLATVLFKRTPFTPEEVAAIEDRARELGFTVLYAPGLPVTEEVGAFLTADDPAAWIARYPLDITPATDDRPFFFNLVRFGDLFSPALRASGVYQISIESAGILLAILGITAAVGVLFVLWPLGWGVRRRGLAAPSARMLVYFGALGVGFMLVEIPTIQRLTVYLGRPVYSLAVGLFALLLFSGLGSLWAGRRRGQPVGAGLAPAPEGQPQGLPLQAPALVQAPMVLVVLIGLNALAVPWVLDRTVGWSAGGPSGGGGAHPGPAGLPDGHALPDGRPAGRGPAARGGPLALGDQRGDVGDGVGALHRAGHPSGHPGHAAHRGRMLRPGRRDVLEGEILTEEGFCGGRRSRPPQNPSPLCIKPQPAVPHAEPPLLADDQVVQHLNPQQTARLHQLPGDGDVVGGGGGVAGGMVVGDDDVGTVAPDGLPEHFPHPNLGQRQVSPVEGLEAQDPVAGVQEEDAEVLLLQVADFGHQERGGVGGGVEGGALFRRGQRHPPPQFQRGLELGRLGDPHPPLRHQFRETGPGQSRQSPVAGQQARRHIQHALAAHARAQDNRQQLGGGEGPRAQPGQPLPRPLRGR
jgi:hypothetical protein